VSRPRHDRHGDDRLERAEPLMPSGDVAWSDVQAQLRAARESERDD
jgi:hypothetical protein